ncbi:MAG: ZIP family metal transporter [Gammaproteobacteria bacterium]
MSLINLKLITALVVLLTTIAAAWLPFRKHLALRSGHSFFVGEALAAGIFLGLGLIHMLGEANDAFSATGYQYPLAFLLAGSTFLLLLFCEHIGMELSERNKQSLAIVVILSVLMLSIHSFLEGAALGVAASVSSLSIILLAILVHKWAISFSLAVKINQSNLSRRQGMAYFALFAIMTPLGVLLATSLSTYVKDYSLVTPFFNSLAAGTFIYIGTLHGLKRSVMVERCCNLKEFLWLVIGFGAIACFELFDGYLT